MRKLIFSLVIGTVLSASAFSQTVPPRVESFLNRNYPGWNIGRSWVVDAPFRKAIEKGDFNGDGKVDYAVFLTKEDRFYALALLANRKGYTAYNLLALKGDRRWVATLLVAKKGHRVFLGPDGESGKSIWLKTDAISLWDGDSGSLIFYWQNGKFVSGEE